MMIIVNPGRVGDENGEKKVTIGTLAPPARPVIRIIYIFMCSAGCATSIIGE